MLDDEREALLAGPLGGLPVDVLRVLCRDAVTLDVPAGSDLFRSGMFAFVVLRGVVRAYVADANGRQLTIRYCRTATCSACQLCSPSGRPTSTSKR